MKYRDVAPNAGSDCGCGQIGWYDRDAVPNVKDEVDEWLPQRAASRENHDQIESIRMSRVIAALPQKLD
jgi:hypothetical protein